MSNHKNIRDWIDTGSKVLIPVTIAFFAWCQHTTTLDVQKLSDERVYDLKLVEMAWKNILDDDTEVVRKTLNLIDTFKPELAAKIASVVFQDTTQSLENRELASDIVMNKSSPLLKGYNIEIFYVNNIPEAKHIAENIQSKIKDEKIVNSIEISAKIKDYFDPLQNIIFYSSNDEKEAAEALASIFKGLSISFNFQLRRDKSISSKTLLVNACRKGTHKIRGPIKAVTATTPARIPGVSQFIENAENSITFSFSNNGNSHVVEYVVYVIENGIDRGYFEGNGSIIGIKPTWQTHSAWHNITVIGLKKSVPYTFKVKARNQAGVTTDFSPLSKQMFTLLKK